MSILQNRWGCAESLLGYRSKQHNTEIRAKHATGRHEKTRILLKQMIVNSGAPEWW